MNKVIIALLIGFVAFQEYLIYSYSQINQQLQESLMQVMNACLAATR